MTGVKAIEKIFKDSEIVKLLSKRQTNEEVTLFVSTGNNVITEVSIRTPERSRLNLMDSIPSDVGTTMKQEALLGIMVVSADRLMLSNYASKASSLMVLGLEEYEIPLECKLEELNKIIQLELNSWLNNSSIAKGCCNCKSR